MAKRVGPRIRLARYSKKLQREEMKRTEKARVKKKKSNLHKRKAKWKRNHNKKKKHIEKIVIEDSKDLGYRSFKGDFDDLRNIPHTGQKRRKELLKRYQGLRKNAARAVKNHENIEFLGNRKRRQVKSKKLRKELSSGLCDICNIRMTSGSEPGFQPWHRETLEHVLDHNLGGTLRKNELAVLCMACNSVLATQKENLFSIEESKDDFMKSLYDFFIFKQVMLISQKAAIRDFNNEYIQFMQLRFSLANDMHRKIVDSIKDKKKKALQNDTVYWSLECFGHSHCFHCGACHSTSSSHDQGHRISYLMK